MKTFAIELVAPSAVVAPTVDVVYHRLAVADLKSRWKEIVLAVEVQLFLPPSQAKVGRGEQKKKKAWYVEGWEGWEWRSDWWQDRRGPEELVGIP